MKPSYRLLAIDLDGTLLNRRGEVSERNLSALERARAAGVRTAVCTGRGLVEARHILERIRQVDPVVVAGGSIVADPVSGSTLHRFAIDQGMVRRAVDRLLAHDHAALVLKDPVEAGYDYLVIQGDQRVPLDPVTEWWFGAMNVKVRFVRRLEEDEHPEHTVRVGACGLSSVFADLKHDLLEACGGDACVHHFPAVVAPEHASRHGSGQTLHVLELFHAHATKWSAVQVLASRLEIAPHQIAAIGDEVNDVPMIQNAGLGIAMGNAIPAVKQAAKRETLRNDEDGVAEAVEKILSGEW